ncbi:MAG: stage II sporulation protein D [Oscillospiraceae bacterium]|nr:stage II sporulation protein D [Oscillospiraceae bacterium]
MNSIIRQAIKAFTLGTVIPGLLFSAAGQWKIPEVSAQPPEVELTEPTWPVQPEQEFTETVAVTVPVLKSDGSVKQMDLEDYICRVVLGEMPASFETEALKAQAVAARTYTLKCVLGGSKHSQGAVCTSHQCCQSYCEPEAYIRNGGTWDNVNKIFDAVQATNGEVLYYDGKLIMATYFSSAGGTTEDAKAVWGNAFPYLTVVESPEGDDAYNGKTVTFTSAQFQKLLGVSLKGKPVSWFGAMTYTVGGGVDQIRIGGKLYKGTQLRTLLGLRSTDFTVSTTDTSVTFTTNGYGHRVGLSQYGADAMATTGSNYVDILYHYYCGTQLGQYSPDND